MRSSRRWLFTLRRASASILATNVRGQSSLWGHGISGDLPIVLLRIADQSKIDLVRQLLHAHAYWRFKGLPVDLVIWNEDQSGYRQLLQDEIVSLAEHCPGLTIYAPVPAERDDVTAETRRKRLWQRAREPAALRDWRQRMASAAGQMVYRRRKLTEHVHARMKNRGFARMPVHGRAKVRVVCLLHALAHNLMHAHWMRAAVAAAP